VKCSVAVNGRQPSGVGRTRPAPLLESGISDGGPESGRTARKYRATGRQGVELAVREARKMIGGGLRPEARDQRSRGQPPASGTSDQHGTAGGQGTEGDEFEFHGRPHRRVAGNKMDRLR
jgi:hypothetical protein